MHIIDTAVADHAEADGARRRLGFAAAGIGRRAGGDGSAGPLFEISVPGSAAAADAVESARATVASSTGDALAPAARAIAVTGCVRARDGFGPGGSAPPARTP